METAQGKYKNKKKKITWGKGLRDDIQQGKIIIRQQMALSSDQ